jgi:hypothetical protein
MIVIILVLWLCLLLSLFNSWIQLFGQTMHQCRWNMFQDTQKQLDVIPTSYVFLCFIDYLYILVSYVCIKLTYKCLEFVEREEREILGIM